MEYGIIAEANLPDPGSYTVLGWLIVGIAAICVAVNNIFKLVDRFKDKPHPGDVQREAVDRFVQKPEFNRAVGELKEEDAKLHQRIGGVDRGATANTERQISELRKDVVGIGKEVAAIQASTELQNQQLGRMESNITRLLERKH